MQIQERLQHHTDRLFVGGWSSPLQSSTISITCRCNFTETRGPTGLVTCAHTHTHTRAHTHTVSRLSNSKVLQPQNPKPKCQTPTPKTLNSTRAKACKQKARNSQETCMSLRPAALGTRRGGEPKRRSHLGESRHRSWGVTVGAFVAGIGLWGPLYYDYNKAPPK